MSSYYDVGLNPRTGKLEKAMWIDDCFGPREYGVQFGENTAPYRASEITRANPCELLDTITALTEEKERLEEALGPFAVAAETMGHILNDDLSIVQMNVNGDERSIITVRDFRRAATALQRGGREQAWLKLEKGDL